MNTKLESEIIAEDEINLYDYWKVLVKRKKILIGIFLVPLAIASAISLSLPRYYRGESKISIPALPAPNISSVITAPNIVRLIGNIDDSQKVKIFTNNPGAIKSVSISLPKKSTDNLNIVVDAKTADIIPLAFMDVFDYIDNMPEIKEEIGRIKERTDLRLNKLIEARKANLIFLDQITDMMKKRQMQFINVNPADLIKKDADLSLEIMNLQQAKTDMMKKTQLSFVNINPTTVSEWKLINKDGNLTLEGMKLQSVNGTSGILGALSITKQPSNSRIKQIIMITGLLSLFTGIFVVFFLEYIDRMKAREK